jgi:hypothetical protein
MIDHWQRIEPRPDEPALLIFRVAGRIRKVFVLLANLRDIVRRFHET